MGRGATFHARNTKAARSTRPPSRISARPGKRDVDAARRRRGEEDGRKEQEVAEEVRKRYYMEVDWRFNAATNWAARGARGLVCDELGERIATTMTSEVSGRGESVGH